MENSMTAEAYPLRTAIQHEQRDGIGIYCWAADNPPWHARYRLEWNFRAQQSRPDTAGADVPDSPSQQMAAIGIVQHGDPILREVAAPFDLPAEADEARRVVSQLVSAMERAARIHHFAKGMGVAAPQLGIRRAATTVRTPDGRRIALLNPIVIEESDATDEQYEGCWSFFDVRGKVSRPVTIHVEHQDVDGSRHITRFDRGDARLVAHEIDHLNGILYSDRLPSPDALIPVSEYRGTGLARRRRADP